MVPYNSIRGERQISHYHSLLRVKTPAFQNRTIFCILQNTWCNYIFLLLCIMVFINPGPSSVGHTEVPYGISFSLGPGEKGTTHTNFIPGPVKLSSSLPPPHCSHSVGISGSDQ